MTLAEVLSGEPVARTATDKSLARWTALSLVVQVGVVGAAIASQAEPAVSESPRVHALHQAARLAATPTGSAEADVAASLPGLAPPSMPLPTGVLLEPVAPSLPERGPRAPGSRRRGSARTFGAAERVSQAVLRIIVADPPRAVLPGDAFDLASIDLPVGAERARVTVVRPVPPGLQRVRGVALIPMSAPTTRKGNGLPSGPRNHDLFAPGPGGSVKLDADRVLGYMRASTISPFRRCFEVSQRALPDIAGKVVVRFTVGAAGRVTQKELLSNTTGDPLLATCVASEIGRLRFAPEPDEPITVTAPIVFQSK